MTGQFYGSSQGNRSTDVTDHTLCTGIRWPRRTNFTVPNGSCICVCVHACLLVWCVRVHISIFDILAVLFVYCLAENNTKRPCVEGTGRRMRFHINVHICTANLNITGYVWPASTLLCRDRSSDDEVSMLSHFFQSTSLLMCVCWGTGGILRFEVAATVSNLVWFSCTCSYRGIRYRCFLCGWSELPTAWGNWSCLFDQGTHLWKYCDMAFGTTRN